MIETPIAADRAAPLLSRWERAGKLNVSATEVERRVETGERLVLVESSFSDPGPDFSSLHLGEETVGYWPGY